MDLINLHLRLRPMLDLMCDGIMQNGEYVGAKCYESLEEVKCKVNVLGYAREEEFWDELLNIYMEDDENENDESKERFSEVKDLVRAAVLYGVALPIGFGRSTRSESPSSSSNKKGKSKKPPKKRVKLTLGSPKSKGAKTKMKSSPSTTLAMDEVDPGYVVFSDMFNSTFEDPAYIASNMKGVSISSVRGNAKLDNEVTKVLSLLHTEGMREGSVASGAPETVDVEKYVSEKSNGIWLFGGVHDKQVVGRGPSPPVGPGGVGKSKGKRYNNQLRGPNIVPSITIKPVAQHVHSWSPQQGDGDFIGASYGSLSLTTSTMARQPNAHSPPYGMPSPPQLPSKVASFSTSTDSGTGVDVAPDNHGWMSVEVEEASECNSLGGGGGGGGGERSVNTFTSFKGVFCLNSNHPVSGDLSGADPLGQSQGQLNVYEASLTLFGRTIALGKFRTAQQAAEAHDRAYLRAMGTQGDLVSDRNKNGALVNGTLHRGPAQLNFHIGRYASDSTELFQKNDAEINKRLWGTQWGGLQHPDFSFVAGMQDNDNEGSMTTTGHDEVTESAEKGRHEGLTLLGDAIQRRSSCSGSSSSSSSSSSSGGSSGSSGSSGSVHGKSKSIRSTLEGLKALFQDGQGTSADPGTAREDQEEDKEEDTSGRNDGNSTREGVPTTPQGLLGLHPSMDLSHEAGAGIGVKGETRAKAYYDGCYDPASLSNSVTSTSTTSSSASDSILDAASTAAPSKGKHVSPSLIVGGRLGAGHSLDEGSPTSPSASSPAPTSLSALVRYDLLSHIPLEVLTRLGGVPGITVVGTGAGLRGVGATVTVTGPLIDDVEMGGGSRAPSPTWSTSSGASKSSTTNGNYNSGAATTRGVAPKEPKFAPYDSVKGMYQCRDIPPEICRILAYEVIAAKDINFGRKERALPLVRVLEAVQWHTYLDKASCAALTGQTPRGGPIESKTMRATGRGKEKEKEKDRGKSRILVGDASGDGSMTASTSTNSLPSEGALSTGTVTAAEEEVSRVLEDNARAWERCLGSKKASRNALSALRTQIRHTVKKLESKSLGTKAYSGVKQLCSEVPVFVFELPAHLVDTSPAPTKAAALVSHENDTDGNCKLLQRGFFGSALEAALVREQILDFTDSARIQGPCSTNFSTKEWSMLTGLGKQIFAFLKISQAKLAEDHIPPQD